MASISVPMVWVGRAIPRCLFVETIDLTIFGLYNVARLVLDFRNDAPALASLAVGDVTLAVVLALMLCYVLVLRKDVVGRLGGLDELSCLDVEGQIDEASSLAVRTVSHADVFSAAGAVLIAVSCAYRAAHP